jgi:two-component system, NtrC family, sensor histidine kinase HydH
VAVLNNVLDSFAATFTKSGITVDWAPDPTYRPRIEGNTSLMTQALHSAISNAVEAMPKGGALRISMRLLEDARRLELTIADTGLGMTKQQLELAFKPFHTTKRHGLGVGLPMLKRVMERFGGAVMLSSAENQGTQVWLQFRMA